MPIKQVRFGALIFVHCFYRTNFIGYLYNNASLDMERKLKMWHCWVTGIAPSVEASAIVASACECNNIVIFGLPWIGIVRFQVALTK